MGTFGALKACYMFTALVLGSYMELFGSCFRIFNSEIVIGALTSKTASRPMQVIPSVNIKPSHPSNIRYSLWYITIYWENSNASWGGGFNNRWRGLQGSLTLVNSCNAQL